MSTSLKVGDKVRWTWGSGTAHGKITERFTDTVTRKIKGSEIKRNATRDDPAFLIEQADGDKVLKSGTEIEKA